MTSTHPVAMATEPAPHIDRMPRFERRVVVGGLLISLPAWAVVAILLFRAPHVGPFWILVPVAAVVTLLLMHWHRRHVAYPVYTLSGLLDALREGDYSLRGARGGLLGDVIYDVNALAEQLKRDRLRYEESTHLLRKTLAALDSAVFVFDEDRRLRLLNPAARRLLGGERKRLFGLGSDELGLVTLLDGGGSRVLTHAFPQRSGRFDVRHTALRRKGRSGQLLVVNDVGRVLRQEERQAWQRLLRVLGHEVNNSLAPIQSIAGTLASLLAADPLPADWREDFRSGLDVVGHRAKALTRFLSGYRELARLPPPQLQRVELSALVSQVAKLEQRLPITIEAGESLFVNADPDQLEQALINLLRNAVEVVPSGNGRVNIQWRRESSRAIIEVQDNGPGPPSSENLFVPFFTTKPGGTGIGLALAQQIAEAHDGGVSLTARADASGAVAKLWLPLT